VPESAVQQVYLLAKTHNGVSKTAQIGLANGIAKLAKSTGETVNSVFPCSTMSGGASNFLEDLAQHFILIVAPNTWQKEI